MKEACVPLTRRAVFRAVGVAAVALVGLFSAGREAVAQARSKMVIGTSADLVHFNPLVSNSRTDTWVTQLMYPRLMQITLEGRKEPHLATKWGYENGGTLARMTLRDDFKWSDGRPVTAEDVAFTITAVAKEKLGTVAGLIPAFVSAKAISPTEVEFTLSRPDGTFLTNIGFWMPVVPAHVFGKAESVKAFANDKDWVSAGPYKIARVEKGQRVVLERVEPYPFAPNSKPTLEQVEFRVFPDVNAQVLALRAGEIDVIANTIPPTLARTLESDRQIKLQKIPSLGWAHLQYNASRKPYDQAAVRQALAHAVNYEAIRRVVLQGQARSTGSSVLTPALPFWQDPSLKEYPYDPKKARTLLESAGFKDENRDGLYDGLNPIMIYDQADPYMANAAQLVRDMSREAGIDIRLSGLERNTYLAKTRERDFDIYAGSWSVMEDPPAYLGLAFRSGAFINYGQVSDPKLDGLIEQAQKALSPDEAKPAVQEAARLIHREMYDNVLYVQDFFIAYNGARWTGFVAQPSDLLSIVNPTSLAVVRPVN